MSTVCVVGLGYIGLPVGAMLASRGHQVIGCDINEAAVASINQGRSRFFEPDLDMLLGAAVQTGRLTAQTVPAEADYYIIAVPTPVEADHRPNLEFVNAAVRSIAPHLRAGSSIIIESTIPVGATERAAAQLRDLRPDLRFPRFRDQRSKIDVHLAHCPERILPGKMVRELVSNDRVIGGMTESCARKAEELYASFVGGKCIVTDSRTAEFVKLIENAFRDVNIAFANELSLISDRLGLDVWKAIDLANRHPRVSILQPGAGVGGHCIAVDPWFIVDGAPQESRLIRTAREVNSAKPRHLVAQIAARADRIKSPVIACYGITYKPDVEDLRESPALEIVRELAAMGSMKVLVCDPFVEVLPEDLRQGGHVELVGADEARERADIAAFLVGHSQFAQLEFDRFRDKIIVDAIGISRSDNATRTITRQPVAFVERRAAPAREPVRNGALAPAA
jgi:UDP-N-acetyl-D-mannosaminuronic acid dehydrogenase